MISPARCEFPVVVRRITTLNMQHREMICRQSYKCHFSNAVKDEFLCLVGSAGLGRCVPGFQRAYAGAWRQGRGLLGGCTAVVKREHLSTSPEPRKSTKHAELEATGFFVGERNPKRNRAFNGNLRSAPTQGKDQPTLSMTAVIGVRPSNHPDTLLQPKQSNPRSIFLPRFPL